MKTGLIAAALVTLGAGGCNAKLPSPPVPVNGKWVIVPMPNGIAIPPATEKQPGVWRLNTQNGDLQFCYLNNASGINCSMWVSAPAMPLYQQ